jgi:nucleotide-binding universal stress UspA family protein
MTAEANPVRDHRIVVGVDGSPSSKAALAWAIGQAKLTGAAQVLLDASAGADLLVVGSRGHGGFVEALLGSVSQHMVHHAACPVVVVRGSLA